MPVILVPGLGRNLLSSSAALAIGVDTTISAFPALKAKGENFSLRADHNIYFLDAILPELQSEYVNVGETSSVMLWHRGHNNAQSIKKITQEKGTGVVVKDTDFSVLNCDMRSSEKKAAEPPEGGAY